MAQGHINVELTDELALPYEPAAELALEGELEVAWQAIVAAFPGLHLDPLFSSLDVAAIADLMDAVRLGGEEPPNLFSSFEIACDESIAATLLPLVQALPFVAFAQIRPATQLAGTVAWGTNPEATDAIQLARAPGGVDAIHAWNVFGGTGSGVRFIDIEDAWSLEHEDIVTGDVMPFSTFGTAQADAGAFDHGTAVLGIVLAGDNGVGSVGIAPSARGFLVTHTRANGTKSIANAVLAAMGAAEIGSVILIELAPIFHPGSKTGGLPPEFEFATQKAIRFVTLFGIVVVEAAGNESVDLDKFPFLAHLQPDHPAFVDSRAIVVGGGKPSGSDVDTVWERHPDSTFGKRVDCFAAFFPVRAPSSSSTSAYQHFSGTSAASAVVAGVVTAMQGMSIAATGQPLHGLDIRRLLRDPDLGTRTDPNRPGGIGAMPDLRKIARHQRWIRVLAVSGAALGNDAMTLVHLDDDDRLVRREWRPQTFFGDPLPMHADDADFVVSPQQPAVVVAHEAAPLTRTVTDVVLIGTTGMLHMAFFDSLGQAGRQSLSKAPFGSVALGRDLAAVRPIIDTLVVVAIDPTGRLVAFTGDASVHVVDGFGAPVLIDALTTFRRAAGPVLVSPLAGAMNAAAIDDGGNLRMYAGTVFATIGTGWAPLPLPPSDVILEPAARPALVNAGGVLVALAVSTHGVLHSCALGVLPPLFEALAPIDETVAIAVNGPVALVPFAASLMAIAVGVDGFVRFATRPVGAGQSWSPLIPIDVDMPVHPAGGACAFAFGTGVAVLAVLRDGRPCWSTFDAATGWLPLRVA